MMLIWFTCFVLSVKVAVAEIGVMNIEESFHHKPATIPPSSLGVIVTGGITSSRSLYHDMK